jgi:OFA family oxalate/formate antiporter-like MFS transporter
MKFGQDPVRFVILTGVVFFAWGEIYSLFPSTCADTFGAKYATTNAGVLYTAKGTASFVIPLANVAVMQFGDWDEVFVAAATVNAIAALMAIFVLKPMRLRMLEQQANVQVLEEANAQMRPVETQPSLAGWSADRAAYS